MKITTLLCIAVLTFGVFGCGKGGGGSPSSTPVSSAASSVSSSLVSSLNSSSTQSSQSVETSSVSSISSIVQSSASIETSSLAVSSSADASSSQTASSISSAESSSEAASSITLISSASSDAVSSVTSSLSVSSIVSSSSVASSSLGRCDNGAINYPSCDQQPLKVVISEPKSLVTLGHTPVLVKGTINKPDALLILNGIPVTHSDGQFQAQVTLQEGYNNIIASATLASEQVTDSLSLSLDLTPPYVTVESHQEGQKVSTPTVTVTGLVNDIVRGTVEAEQAQVKVNDVLALVSNRSYAAKNIPLNEGINIIKITASDQVGNVETKTLTLTYQPPQNKHIQLVSGQDQTASIAGVLPQPLAVKLVDDKGQALANEPVVFRVMQDSGEVAAGTDKEGRAVVLVTDANGLASTQFRVGLRTGVANNKVKVAAVGFEGEVIFNASATTKVGNKLSVNSGNNQRGAINQILPAPLVAVVTDEGANVVKDARVRFDMITGGGEFENKLPSIEAQTDSDGRATVRFILGPKEGIDQQHVRATLIDAPLNQSIVAGFNATGFVQADPGLTTVSGVVLDNQDNPIPGITMHIEGTTRKAVTNEQGRFSIASAPVGPIHLVADGSTASVAGEYPNLSYRMVTIAGVDNPVSAPIYMVKLNTVEAVLAGKNDVSIQLDKYPGFKLDIAKNSVTFPDGAREGYVSVTAVNASAVPMAPPNGMQPQFIVTIQPTGTRFDPPARLALPNVDAHPPGAQVEMYSYDHDLEEFVSIGLGTVSEDGAIIQTNPGVGVVKAGWHCGSQPGGSGTAASCPECNKCDGTTCVSDPSQKDTPLAKQTPEDCNTATCGGSKPDDGDKPALTKANNCETCSAGKRVPNTPQSQCCNAVPSSFWSSGGGTAAAGVACCNGQQTICTDPNPTPLYSNATAQGIYSTCNQEHERAHFPHVDCPDCTNSHPGFKPDVNPAEGECQGYKASVACIERLKGGCGTDAACSQIMTDLIQFYTAQGNTGGGNTSDPSFHCF